VRSILCVGSVDNLAKVTQEELRLAIGKCTTMMVVLNDETHLSEWCVYEWRMAAELGVPVKVVLDMERSSKQSSLALIGPTHPNLMQYQWTELTERHRRECLAEGIEPDPADRTCGASVVLRSRSVGCVRANFTMLLDAWSRFHSERLSRGYYERIDDQSGRGR
jgi:hypothetical protein